MLHHQQQSQQQSQRQQRHQDPLYFHPTVYPLQQREEQVFTVMHQRRQREGHTLLPPRVPLRPSTRATELASMDHDSDALGSSISDTATDISFDTTSTATTTSSSRNDLGNISYAHLLVPAGSDSTSEECSSLNGTTIWERQSSGDVIDCTGPGSILHWLRSLLPQTVLASEEDCQRRQRQRDG